MSWKIARFEHPGLLKNVGEVFVVKDLGGENSTVERLWSSGRDREIERVGG